MEEELKLDQAVPTLTFEPFTETKRSAGATAGNAKARANLRRRSIVKRAGKKQVEAFAEKIDLNNSTLVLQYGAGAQKRSQIFLTKRLKMSDQKILARQEPCWQA